MILKRHSSPVSWQEHYHNYTNPELATRLLRKAVPVLEHVGWEVVEVNEGHAVTSLPLNRASTNQHGTHQAALISLSADYTGGIALASLLRGVSLAGIHPHADDNSASLWLADMSVRYRSPSTGHLTGECHVPELLVQKIVNRYFSQKKVFVKLPMTFHSNGELVAEAVMSYFVQPTLQLRPTIEKPEISTIYETKLKASARMIAGVRAMRSQNGMLRIDNPHAEIAAGPHGRLLAERLQSALPQLTDMVHARTQHGDGLLKSVPNLKQVVLVGAGLDMRPFRLQDQLGDVTWFELDLPVMLAERQGAIEQLPNTQPVQRHAIPMDLLLDDLTELLDDHPAFVPNVPTLFLYEGCTMYFDSDMNAQIVKQIRRLMQHPDSRLWCDMVTETAIIESETNEKIRAFQDNMEELGEKFIFGHNQPTEFMRGCGYSDAEVTSVAEFIASDDPVHSLYNFVVARA